MVSSFEHCAYKLQMLAAINIYTIHNDIHCTWHWNILCILQANSVSASKLCCLCKTYADHSFLSIEGAKLCKQKKIKGLLGFSLLKSWF